MDKPPSAHRHLRKPVSGQRLFRDSAAWKKHRALVRDHYMHVCVCCVLRHPDQRPRRSTQVHHITPLSVQPRLALAWSNTVPVCDECHEMLTVLENGGHHAQAAAVFDNWIERMEDTIYVAGK